MGAGVVRVRVQDRLGKDWGLGFGIARVALGLEIRDSGGLGLQIRVNLRVRGGARYNDRL